MKKNPYSEMFRGMGKEVDESAYTVDEISREIGISYAQAGKRAKQMVFEGAWEQVWKRGTRFLVPAYRPKQ